MVYHNPKPNQPTNHNHRSKENAMIPDSRIPISNYADGVIQKMPARKRNTNQEKEKVIIYSLRASRPIIATQQPSQRTYRHRRRRTPKQRRDLHGPRDPRRCSRFGRRRPRPRRLLRIPRRGGRVPRRGGIGGARQGRVHAHRGATRGDRVGVRGERDRGRGGRVGPEDRSRGARRRRWWCGSGAGIQHGVDDVQHAVGEQDVGDNDAGGAVDEDGAGRGQGDIERFRVAGEGGHVGGVGEQGRVALRGGDDVVGEDGGEVGGGPGGRDVADGLEGEVARREDGEVRGGVEGVQEGTLGLRCETQGAEEGGQCGGLQRRRRGLGQGQDGVDDVEDAVGEGDVLLPVFPC